MVISAGLVRYRIIARGGDENLAITIQAPNVVRDIPSARPSLSLAIVIDRSGSMHGAPIEHAKDAALSVLRQLGASDAFSIVTYSSASESVLPMQRATEANKLAARAAIEAIEDDGGTCISCGLETGAREVGRSPVEGGLRRILLISDGQANEGVYDRDELAQLAAATAARGTSISTVGVGLEFDEVTMRRLAEVGHGNYFFVEDTVALSTMFSRELGNLGQTVASEVRLVVIPGPGVHIEEAYGYPMTRDGDRAIVPVADLRAGELRKVVLRVTVGAHAEGPLAVAQVELAWRRVADGATRSARTAAQVDVVTDPAAVAASVDPAIAPVVEQALSARALEEAASAYDQDGIAGAREVLERRARAVRANARNLPPETVQSLEAVSRDAIEGYTRAPAQAKKATSVKAYELAR